MSLAEVIGSDGFNGGNDAKSWKVTDEMDKAGKECGYLQIRDLKDCEKGMFI